MSAFRVQVHKISIVSFYLSMLKRHNWHLLLLPFLGKKYRGPYYLLCPLSLLFSVNAPQTLEVDRDSSS